MKKLKTNSVDSPYVAADLLTRIFFGFYRVREVNAIYECGWIFVSNEVNRAEAEKIQEKHEKQNPHLLYHIVPVYTFSKT